VGTDPGIGWLLARTSERGDAVTLVSEKDPYIRSYVLFSPISVSLCHLCHRLRGPMKKCAVRTEEAFVDLLC
jgi:hypothetical protein